MGYKDENLGGMEMVREKVRETEVLEKAEPKPFQPKIAWANVVGFVILHLMALYGWYLMLTFQIKLSTFIFMLAVLMYNGTSITLGAHRLWAHRSYKAKLPLRIILLIGQTMAGQNCLWVWARDHRQHHKYSDTDADPHNSNRGFFFSHIGWLMQQKHPDVIAQGRKMDMTDLSADPWIMFQKRHYNILYVIFALGIPVLTPWYFWNETILNSFFVCYCVKYTFQLNATWAVNSFAHMYGTKPYNKNICPVENTYVSFFGLGEGWHNYHHTFPWDCHASEYGKFYNFTSTVLNFMEKLGQAYDLKMASSQLMYRRIAKDGDGTHIPVN